MNVDAILAASQHEGIVAGTPPGVVTSERAAV
jgi:hypothetical protein